MKSSFSCRAKFSFDALAPEALHHGKVRAQPMETSLELGSQVSGGGDTSEFLNESLHLSLRFLEHPNRLPIVSEIRSD